jgi:spermidine synthase
MMAHLPLAFLGRPRENALVICFGMGTTHRSMLSWGIHSTAVELVPSVPSVFYFFHPDAPTLLKSPQSEVVIGDGRFYLESSPTQYDVIMIDPPPPVPAAASSLLYSKEFYALASNHLRPGGILQQWLPGADADVSASMARSARELPLRPRVRINRRLGHSLPRQRSPDPSYTPVRLDQPFASTSRH